MRVLAPAAVAVALLAAAPASARPLAHERMAVGSAVAENCADPAHRGSGTASRSFRATAGGYLTARLDAARGDWDLAVFRRGQADPVAASAYRGAHEVASGFVRRGERLTLRACRRTGPARIARVAVEIDRVGRGAGARATPVRRASAPARAAVRVRAAALPSGRSATYRRLADYGNEMRALAAANPDVVRPITLPLRSRLGRPVEGLKITTNPGARDGKPVYLQLGMHHSNEWPAAELPMEWAYELINAYRAGDARTRSLVARVRTIIVPVVNPDGFNFSREAEGTGSAAEHHRKNCTPTGCFVSEGVDVNRNYGDLWGGEGSGDNPASNTYRGTAPFSEPEAENVRRLISNRQVVMLITNHTFGNEILRQPGTSADGPTPDEPLFRALGEEMAAENGYNNIFSYEIGNHVGTADGWSYHTTGGLGYVFEIHPTTSHPPYADVVQHYDGSAVPGGGNREAYYVAMESAANPAHHAVLRGSAPPGAILRLRKTFRNRVSVGSPTLERFDTTMQVPASGRFEWHVNQSSRPRVPGETWTLTCERPERTVQTGQALAIARGQSRELDLSACGPAGPPVETRPRPAISLRLVAGVRGRIYRARVSGALRRVADLERCDGVVALSLMARRTPLRKKRAGLDERCRFERRFKFRRGELPKRLRKPGAVVRLRAFAAWRGNEFLAPAEKSVSRRVVRRRR
jgi:carboxypeptidase T